MSVIEKILRLDHTFAALVAVLLIQSLFWLAKRRKGSRGSFALEKFFSFERLQETLKDKGDRTLLYLYTYIFSAKGIVPELAAVAMEDRLSNLLPGRWFALDQLMRQRGAYSLGGNYGGWEGLQEMLPVFQGRFRAFALLASHPDGHIREKVLQTVSQTKTGVEIPFIALRCADWVAPLRKRAQHMLSERLAPSHALAIAMNLSLILRVLQSHKEGTSELLVKLVRFLGTEEGQKGLVLALKKNDPENRRACLTYLDPAQTAVLKMIFREGDERTRFLAAKRMAERPEDYSSEIAGLAGDSHPFLRCFYLEWLAEKKDPRLEEYLQGFLVDGNRTLRRTARFQWRKRGKTDFREDYLRVLETGTPRQKAGALLGIGEIEAKDLVQKAAEFVDAGHPRVEAAAIKTLSDLAPEKYRDVFRRKMMVPRSKAAKLALRAYGRLSGGVTLPHLEELVAEGLGPSPALTLADQMTEWDRIYWCLRSLELSDKVAADRSLARLDGWLHNGYAEAPFPSKDQFERIKPLLGNLEGKLSEEKVRMLQFALGQN